MTICNGLSYQLSHILRLITGLKVLFPGEVEVVYFLFGQVLMRFSAPFVIYKCLTKRYRKTVVKLYLHNYHILGIK